MICRNDDGEIYLAEAADSSAGKAVTQKDLKDSIQEIIQSAKETEGHRI